MTEWPRTFPCPLIDGFSAEAFSAVLRTPFQAGNTRQRRIHDQLPHAIRLSWVFKQDDYGAVLNWMNVKAWNWFRINLPGPLAGVHKSPTWPHIVRFISDIDAKLIHAADGFYWQVGVVAEWMPSTSDFGPGSPVFRSFDWVIAGTPRAASAPDWIISGTPSARSTPNVYVAGTPDSPAAIV